jgi:hypothetical protein
MPVGDGDAVVFLPDFGVAVTFTGAPAGTLGILDVQDEERLTDDGRATVLVRVKVVLLETTVAALLSDGDAITVDGTNYTVRDVVAVADGTFSVVGLRNA